MPELLGTCRHDFAGRYGGTQFRYLSILGEPERDLSSQMSAVCKDIWTGTIFVPYQDHRHLSSYDPVRHR